MTPSPQSPGRLLEAMVIEKDVPVEQVAFDRGQCGLLADVVPCVPDDADLPVNESFAAFSPSWKPGAASRQAASVLVRLSPAISIA